MPPEPSVLLIAAHECGPDTLYALAVKGYRYEATGISGALVFVRDGSVRLREAPAPAEAPDAKPEA